MGKVHQYSEQSTEDYAFSAFIKLDNLQIKTTRTTFNFISWLALVSGSLKSVKVICMFLVTAYVKRDFMNNVLGALFLVKNFVDERDEGRPIELKESTF